MQCDLSISALEDFQPSWALLAIPFHLAALRKLYDAAHKASTHEAPDMAQDSRSSDRGLQQGHLCSSHGESGALSICNNSKGAALMCTLTVATAVCFWHVFLDDADCWSLPLRLVGEELAGHDHPHHIVRHGEQLQPKEDQFGLYLGI